MRQAEGGGRALGHPLVPSVHDADFRGSSLSFVQLKTPSIGGYRCRLGVCLLLRGAGEAKHSPRMLVGGWGVEGGC